MKKVWQIVAIASTEGELELPTYEVIYFDPEAEKYMHVASEPFSVLVTPNNDLRAVMRNAEKKTPAQSKPGPQEPGQQEEDNLSPLHETSLLLGSRPTWAYSIRPYVLSFTPALFLTALVLLSHRQALRDNPAYSARLSAYLTATKALQESSNTSEQTRLIFRTYLKHRFSLQEGQLDPKRLGDILCQKTKNASFTSKVSDFLAELERQQFSSQFSATQNADPETQRTKALELIREVERNLK